MMYSGVALIATITATFHANRRERTNVRSVSSVSDWDGGRVGHDAPKYSGRNTIETA